MRALLVIALVAIAVPARADGTLSMRGVYYKEKATRVVEPMFDGAFDVGDEDEADVHMLIDAVTSASVASGTTDGAFSERRWEFGGGYRHHLADTVLGGQARLSYEPDYTSYFAGASVEQALADQMTRLGASFGIGHDDVGQRGALGVVMDAGNLSTLLASLQLTQVLSPNTVAGVTYDFVRLDGYQENPYRSAITAAGLAPERHPDLRNRHAFAGTLRRYLPSTSTTVIATYRYYIDSWSLQAHTPELRLIQDAGDGIDVTVGYRFHWQSAADFYRKSYPSNDPDEFPYITDDVKLSQFTSHAVAIKVGVLGQVLGFDGTLEGARAELIFEYVDQNNRFGNAVVAHAALTLPFIY